MIEEIILEGKDSDGDPLAFDIVDNPLFGAIQGLLDVIFQQKFTDTGSLGFSSFLLFDGGTIVADSDNDRILAVNSDGTLLESNDVPFLGGIPFTPHSILPKEDVPKFTKFTAGTADPSEFRLFDWDRNLLYIPASNNIIQLQGDLQNPTSVDQHPTLDYFIVDGNFIVNLDEQGQLIRKVNVDDFTFNITPQCPPETHLNPFQDCSLAPPCPSGMVLRGFSGECGPENIFNPTCPAPYFPKGVICVANKIPNIINPEFLGIAPICSETDFVDSSASTIKMYISDWPNSRIVEVDWPSTSIPTVTQQFIVRKLLKPREPVSVNFC